MGGKAIIIMLIAMLVLGVIGTSTGWDPILGMGFVLCLTGLLYAIGSLGSRQGGGDLNESRPPQF